MSKLVETDMWGEWEDIIPPWTSLELWSGPLWMLSVQVHMPLCTCPPVHSNPQFCVSKLPWKQVHKFCTFRPHVIVWTRSRFMHTWSPLPFDSNHKGEMCMHVGSWEGNQKPDLMTCNPSRASIFFGFAEDLTQSKPPPTTSASS